VFDETNFPFSANNAGLSSPASLDFLVDDSDDLAPLLQGVAPQPGGRGSVPPSGTPTQPGGRGRGSVPPSGSPTLPGGSGFVPPSGSPPQPGGRGSVPLSGSTPLDFPAVISCGRVVPAVPPTS